LSKRYEEELVRKGISACPIAYRRISQDSGSGGKCNIDFAKDAFEEIEGLGNCVAVASDIRSYFETIDHDKIKHYWGKLLECWVLPDDHYAVYTNITKYRCVDQRDVFRRLGYLGPVERNGRVVEGFVIPFKEIPKKLCSNNDFKNKICGGDPTFPSLVQRNDGSFGVPQGAPISDLIANFVLIDFDQVMATYASLRGGVYMRYSDDILLILPGGPDEGREAEALAIAEIAKHG
jgi:hypothetical protein